jgi:hypothetical protein
MKECHENGSVAVLRHGELANSIYAPGGSGESWAGSSTDEDRQDGEVSGIVRRYRKEEQASISVTAINLIKAAHPDAIEYIGISAHVRWLAIFWGFFSLCVLVGLGWMFLDYLISVGFERTFYQFLAFVSCFFILAGFYFLLWGIRAELFRPEDEPIIFDRKHRKVYRLFRVAHPGLKGLFMRWPIRAAEYGWDLIDAEHNAVLITTGSTAIRYHSLVFIVRKSATDPTVIDSFPVGSSVQLGEFSVDPVLEHIRRFMEEEGPHLPPGERVNARMRPETFWQSMVEVAPVGPAYTTGWKNMPAIMVLFHLLSPIFVPIFLLWGFFNWISYKTSVPVYWPSEVNAAVGV